MTEAQAKRQLRAMLRALTPGSVLHLLAELLHEFAKRAHRRGDEPSAKQARDTAATLFVVGLGVDAAYPR